MTDPTWVIRLPWTTPPLTANQRHGHWAKKAAIVRTVRGTSCVLARQHRIPSAAAIRVTLTYHPRRDGRRDAENLVDTLKALCDGLVDAGIVPDDTPDLMVKDMPHIAPPDPADPRLTLTVHLLPEGPAPA